MRVRVFRNLTRRCLSIQARTSTGWRTVAHASAVALADAEFTVSEAGRQRVIATGRKNVHAFVVGDLQRWSGSMRPEFVQTPVGEMLDLSGTGPHAALPVALSYNPKAGPHFSRRDGAGPVKAAARAMLGPQGVTCASPV